MSRDPLRCQRAEFRAAKFDSEAYFRRAKFDSDTNFEKAEFDNGAIFRAAEFDSATSFSFAKFDNRATFMGAKFDSVTAFQGAEFDSEATFSFAKFENWAFFGGATFFSVASFQESEFDNMASFVAAKFDSTTYFHGAKFASGANFYGAKFANEAYFHGAQFAMEVDFNRADFTSKAYFVEAEFANHVDFGGAKFASEADFSHAQFAIEVDFSRAILPDSLFFKEVSIEESIDFTYALLDSAKATDTDYRSNIALEGTDISKIRINSDLFQLWFPGLDKNNQRDAEKIIDIYQDVLKKLETDGLTRSYRDFDIEYKTLDNELEGRHFANFFNTYWWNYGYNREWVVWWSLAWLGLFTLVNALLFKPLMNSVYTISQLELGETVFSLNFLKYPKWSQKLIRWLNNFLDVIKRLILSLYYTSFVFFGLRMNFEKLHKPETTGAFILMGYLFLVYTIGLFCTGYLVAIIFIA